MPGDPISAMLVTAQRSGTSGSHDAEALARYYGLDRPLVEQYGHYMAGLARGDLGVSIPRNRPVSELLGQRLPWTLLLAGTAVPVAAAIGLAAGAHSAWRRDERSDRGLLAVFVLLGAVPPFFLASIASFIFAVSLGWFPLAGQSTPFSEFGGVARVSDVVRHLVLPAATLAVAFATGPYLAMRAGMLGQLGAPYLMAARAKGVAERGLKYRHAARNALAPVITVAALDLGAAASTGVIFVEAVFAYPGMGQLLVEALEARDYPTLQGCFLVLALLVLTVNLLADAIGLRLDPRTSR